MGKKKLVTIPIFAIVCYYTYNAALIIDSLISLAGINIKLLPILFLYSLPLILTTLSIVFYIRQRYMLFFILIHSLSAYWLYTVAVDWIGGDPTKYITLEAGVWIVKFTNKPIYDSLITITCAAVLILTNIIFYKSDYNRAKQR